MSGAAAAAAAAGGATAAMMSGGGGRLWVLILIFGALIGTIICFDKCTHTKHKHIHKHIHKHHTHGI